MVNTLLEAFPNNFKPNKQQQKLLSHIEEAIKSDYKFIVCCAPTGSGKSFISKTLSNIAEKHTSEFKDLVTSYRIFKREMGGGYVYADEAKDLGSGGLFALTITKALQDQYKDLFDDVRVMKGKSNYQCMYDQNYSVEHAPCIHTSKIKEQCWSTNICPYYTARNETLISDFATLNYNMFFALPDHVKYKDYIICDEASELEDQLVKEFTCNINYDTLKRYKIQIMPFPGEKEYGKINRWLNSLCSNIEDVVLELKDIIAKNSKKLPVIVREKASELAALQKIQSKIKTLIETWYDSEYICERLNNGITFMPLKVDVLAKNIFNFGKKIILMSATIIDHKEFCKTLGIEKYKYIEAESTFDSNKAPIFITTKVKLNYNNLKTNLPKLVKQIKQICDSHPNVKGIIHTQTNTITEYLKMNIQSERFLFREPGVKNEDILEKHYASNTPTILVSPSMSYGVDLRDDLARFQIIIKAPFLPMVDNRVKRMMKDNFNWYINKMLSSLIQSCGRGIRSHNDHCKTYILDGAIAESIINNKHKLPKYFIDRFV
jgi:Rad3-related DNA helicase